MTELLETWMGRMETKVDGLRDDMAQMMTTRERVDEHHDRLYGNGQPGIIKDVDRLKQWRHSWRWLTGVMGVVVAAAAAELVRVIWWGR